MKRLFGHKIGYIVATFICIGAVFYFVNTLRGLQSTQKQLNEAYRIFERTNTLVSSLNMAQAFGERYIITQNVEFLNSYREEVDNGLLIIDTLFVELPETQQNQLLALAKLFEQKEILLQEDFDRNYFLNYENVFVATQQTTFHVSDDEFRIGTGTEIDTTFMPDNRNFFQRLFSSRQEPTQIITIRQNDSIIHEHIIEHSAFAPKSVDAALRAVARRQQQQFERLEQQYMALLSADQKIGQDISAVLIQLHETALNRVTEMLSQKDESSRRVLFAGILSFLVLSAVVFVIFRSAEKSLIKSREMSESKRIAEELMNSRHQLLLSISHDVKAPLISILSYLEFWDKDDLSVEEIRQLSSMQNSATHILNMLTNLLEFSRLEQKKVQIQNQTVEPIPLFLEIVDLFKPMANSKHLKFSYQFKKLDDCQITIDSLKLRQIVTNLISNAIKYTAQGEIQFFVELLDDPARLKIVISDSGIGIPKEKLDRIFDSFSQVENRPANTEGTGFGLFVVKGLTDVMNGTIHVESSEKGTTFDLELPVSEL
ncbi:MAG: HAMP domain-containing histidine kinase [Bacteroidales bacterium]|nr:HAMP domain-containing histidine kinase [Bacteroidales bacterium]